MALTRKAITAAAVVTAAAALAACSSASTSPARPVVPKPSVAVTAMWPTIISEACAFQRQGMNAAQVYNALYEAPESAAQMHAVVAYALTQCPGGQADGQ